MVRLFIRHVSGSRATEVDVVELGAHRELIFGRADSAAVRFDPRLDAMVGRHHARLDWDPDAPTSLRLIDLESRNGTWVNGCRIASAVSLLAGDVVQLGTRGPSFEVQFEVHVDLRHGVRQPIRPLS
jgi:pSer/pThr/pTyr-binding forkhead associated (FHA) protein